MSGNDLQIELRLPDRPESPTHARESLRDLAGPPAQRIDDARLLLHELVAAALLEGVGAVDVHIRITRSRLHLEVVGEPRAPRRGDRRLTGAARLGRNLIRDLSDRCGGDGRTLWCELDGAWSLGEPTVHVRPTPTGVWQVYVDRNREPASQHMTATDAERSAAAVAAKLHQAEIVVHDAYHRARSVRTRKR